MLSAPTLAAAALLLSCKADRDDTGLGDHTGAVDDTGSSGDTGSASSTAASLLPLPASVETVPGTLLLDKSTSILASTEAQAVAELLAESLRTPTGLPLDLVLTDDPDGDASASDIRLVLDPAASSQDEGYSLSVGADGVRIAAPAPPGIFYGSQTLRQLLPPAAFAPELQPDVAWSLPWVQVDDLPAHPWRGGMIDIARHFFDAAALRRQIDLYALHKLNRLHLHLTDDQGWRIEIQSWPDLAIIGGATEVGGGAGGYFTQDEYVDLVAYAADRFVTIVPEVDVPGHANAALASYGELNEDGLAAEPYTEEPVLTAPLYLDAPETWIMVQDVFQELAAITPGPWLHVGGDEAIDLSTADYADFMQWLHGVVDDQGKTLIAWDEVGEADLDAPYTCQFWWQEDLARRAADAGAQLIYSYASQCYLDMVYDYDAEYGQIWAGPIDIETAYRCRPDVDGVDAAALLGVEAPIWTEYIDTQDQLDFMLWPRLSAVAEVGWTADDQLDWASLQQRLVQHGQRLDAIGVAYNRTEEVDWD